MNRRLTACNFRFFYYYRDIAGTLYPVLVDVPGFEKELQIFLQNRAAAGGILKTGDEPGLTQRPFGMNLAFVGMLFAVLASGCQSSDLPSKERELTSQVYGELTPGQALPNGTNCAQSVVPTNVSACVILSRNLLSRQ